MNQILEGVMPDGLIGTEAAEKLKAGFPIVTTITKHVAFDNDVAVYSRETVESLLSQCRKEARKEALLEAQQTSQHEDVLAPVGNSAYGEAYQDGWIAGVEAYRNELRRMADSVGIQQ